MPRRDWLQGFADTAIREKHVVTFQFGNVEIVLTRRGNCKYRTRPSKRTSGGNVAKIWATARLGIYRMNRAPSRDSRVPKLMRRENRRDCRLTGHWLLAAGGFFHG